MFSPTSATLTTPSVRCPQRGLIEPPLEHGEGGLRRLEPRVRDSVADRSIGEQVYCRNAATRDVRNALLLMIEKKP